MYIIIQVLVHVNGRRCNNYIYNRLNIKQNTIKKKGGDVQHVSIFLLFINCRSQSRGVFFFFIKYRVILADTDSVKYNFTGLDGRRLF